MLYFSTVAALIILELTPFIDMMSMRDENVKNSIRFPESP